MIDTISLPSDTSGRYRWTVSNDPGPPGQQNPPPPLNRSAEGNVLPNVPSTASASGERMADDAFVRARQSRPPETGQDAFDTLPAQDDADRTLESWAVAEALASLRPDHRSVIVETYYRGCSVAEAAATLGIPPGTVKSRTYYALKALKLALQERGLAP